MSQMADRGLRNTTINLNWNVNGQPLQDANRMVDEAIRASRTLDRQNAEAGRQIEHTGRQYRSATDSVRLNSDSLQNNASASIRASDRHIDLARHVQTTTSRIDDSRRAMDKASSSAKVFAEKADKIGEKMDGIGSKMTAGLTAPILAAGVAAVKYASDTNESINKVEVAFGSSDKSVENWSTHTLKNIGLAQGTALDMAATFGDMSTSMGFSTDKASDMSTKMVDLAGDLASFKNIGIDQANTALNGVFTGETESLKSLGVVMTQTNLQQFAYSKGISKKIKDMSQAEQVELRYQFVMENTKNAQGDFARTASGTANTMRVFTESTKQLASSIGQNLLPVVTPMIQKATDLVNAFGELSPEKQQKIIKWAAIAAAAGPVILMFGKVTGAIGSISEAMESAKKLMPSYRREMALTATQSLVSASEMETSSNTIGSNGTTAVGSRSSRRQTTIGGRFSRLFRRGTSTAADVGQEVETVTDTARTATSTAGRVSRFASMGSKLAKGTGYLSIGLSALDLIKSTKKNVVENIGGTTGSTAGMAIGAAIGSAIAPGIGTAIGGAVGSWAGTYLGSTIGKSLQKSHPELVKNVSNAFGSLKGIFTDPLDTSFKASDGISRSTQKSINAYENLNQKASEQLNYLAMSGDTMSAKTAESIHKNFNDMESKIDSALDKKASKSKSNLDLLVQNGAISSTDRDKASQELDSKLKKQKDSVAENSKQIIDLVNKMYNEQSATTKRAEDQINQIKSKATKEGRKLTSDELYQISKLEKDSAEERKGIAKKYNDQISSLQEKQENQAVTSMSRGAKEQNIIFGKLANSTEKLSAKQAASVVSHSIKARDGAIKAANEKYDKVMKAADEEYFVNHSISEEQYKTIKSNAEKTRDDTVKAAKDMNTKVVDQAQQQASGHISQVDWETGQSLSKWDNFVIGLAEKVNAVSSGINEVLDFFHISAKIPTWKPTGYASAQSLKSENFKPRNVVENKLYHLSGYASGTSYHPGGRALVGEEGPELSYEPYSGKASILGANGPEVANIPRGASILPASQTRSILNGGLGSGKVLPGYAGGVGDFISTAFDWVAHPIKKASELFAKNMNFGKNDIGPGKGLGVGLLEYYRDKAGVWLKDTLSPFSGIGAKGKAASGQVMQWILSAMSLTGAPESWLSPLMTIAMKESGGNPSAVNNWDSNAKSGHASRGLFQTIPSTFAAYAMSGLNNILNPVDNAVAAINYIMSRYGSPFNTPGIKSASKGGGYKGYKSGGQPPVGEDVLVGEDGPEIFNARTPGQIQNAQKTQQILKNRNGVNIEINAPVTITIQGNADKGVETNIKKAVDAALDAAFDKWTRALGLEMG